MSPRTPSKRPPIAAPDFDEDDFDDERPKKRNPRPADERGASAPKRRKIVLTDQRPKKSAEPATKSPQKLSAPGSARPPAVTKRDLAVVSSHFENSSREILDLLSHDETTDGAISMLARSLLEVVIRTIPLAESQVRNTEGRAGVYQLNQLLTQARDTMVDLQNLREKSQVGRLIVERQVRPAYENLAAQVSLAMTSLVTTAAEYMGKSEHKEFRAAAQAIKVDLSNFMSRQYEELSESVGKSLS